MRLCAHEITHGEQQYTNSMHLKTGDMLVTGATANTSLPEVDYLTADIIVLVFLLILSVI